MTYFSETLEVVHEDFHEVLAPEMLLDKTCGGCVRCVRSEIVEKRDTIAVCRITILISIRKIMHVPIGGIRKSMNASNV